MLEQTDCCSVLARGSSLTSSLFSKTETDSVKTSVAVPHSGSWDRRSRLLLSPCSVQTSAPPYPAFLSAVWLWVQLSWPQTCLCICNHSFVYVHSWNQRWHMQLMLALEESCVHLFACVFHYAAKVGLTRLRWVWSGLPEDPWCKTRRNKALEKNVFAVLFTRVSKAFVKMLLCWSQSDS